MQSMPQGLDAPEFVKALTELGQIAQNEPDRARYEARLRAWRDERARFEYARRAGLDSLA